MSNLYACSIGAVESKFHLTITTIDLEVTKIHKLQDVDIYIMNNSPVTSFNPLWNHEEHADILSENFTMFVATHEQIPQVLKIASMAYSIYLEKRLLKAQKELKKAKELVASYSKIDLQKTTVIPDNLLYYVPLEIRPLFKPD